jgi:lipoyl(octanoyl) transferase
MRTRDLGEQPYLQTLQAMREFTHLRTEQTEDEIWLIEHPPVFTLGLAGKSEHVLNPGPIPVEKVERGGQVTYHGPGQIVAYTLFDLRRLKLGVRELVCQLEQCIIDTLAGFSIDAHRRAGAPGVYLPSGEKIAALGLKISRHCSFHGLALNYAMDLQPFSLINPCGYKGLVVTDMRSVLSPKHCPAHGTVKSALIAQLERQFARV